jgi:hypothetical protein
MLGNVWEWTSDRWTILHPPWAEGDPPLRNPSGPTAAAVLAEGAPRADAAGQGRPAERVKKGGSFLCHESYCFRYRVEARYEAKIGWTRRRRREKKYQQLGAPPDIPRMQGGLRFPPTPPPPLPARKVVVLGWLVLPKATPHDDPLWEEEPGESTETSPPPPPHGLPLPPLPHSPPFSPMAVPTRYIGGVGRGGIPCTTKIGRGLCEVERVVQPFPRYCSGPRAAGVYPLPKRRNA